jgi:hypothetical protein
VAEGRVREIEFNQRVFPHPRHCPLHREIGGIERVERRRKIVDRESLRPPHAAKMSKPPR